MSSAEIRKKTKKMLDKADDRMVKMVYALLEADKEDDWWDDLPKEVQDSIDKAIAELDAGKGIPHDVVMKLKF
ncbi:MAG TPA: hypothetical protein VI461_03765 [Chitinophagaceae bacterium]|nr:hypothetical protein [Chitinophagaceae bacterium]